MGDTGSDMAGLRSQATETDLAADKPTRPPGLAAPSSNDQPTRDRNPAWLVLEILFITVLVFFWL